MQIISDFTSSFLCAKEKFPPAPSTTASHYFNVLMLFRKTQLAEAEERVKNAMKNLESQKGKNEGKPSELHVNLNLEQEDLAQITQQFKKSTVDLMESKNNENEQNHLFVNPSQLSKVLD